MGIGFGLVFVANLRKPHLPEGGTHRGARSVEEAIAAIRVGWYLLESLSI